MSDTPTAQVHWAEIQIDAKPDETDWVGWLLVEVAGCHGYAVEDPGVVGYLPIDDRLESALLRLRERLGRPLTVRRRIAEEDWAHAWKQYFKPQRIGERFLIKPSWEPVSPLPTDLVLEVDPGMAFGTGLHATTRLCLMALERWLKPGALVSDVGTGSGILAVGAALLGASHVDATDNDPLAVRIARENVERNAVGALVRVEESETPPNGPRDIVVANILPDVILGMADALAASVAPGGTLITSGIIHARVRDVETGLVARGLEWVESPVEGDWAAVVVRRPAGV